LSFLCVWFRRPLRSTLFPYTTLFRSQLAESPEVYSAARAGEGAMTGYCFRFARPEDFDDIAHRVAPGRAGFADELRDNVASLKVDRKSTRLNSSHVKISYAVLCLKKK